MNSGLFELIRTFARVVETGSFTAVARETGSTQPTVSRQIGALEQHLGVRLFARTTRALNLTDEGRSYYDHCLGILDAVEQAAASIALGREQVTGTLRFAGPLAFSRLQVIPRLKKFLQRWPEISLDLTLSDKTADLVEEGIDVAIRIGSIDDDNLIVRRIGETRRVTVAAPDYLESRRAPIHPIDLQDHDCIVYTGLSTRDDWLFAETHSNELRANKKNPDEMLRVKVSGRLKVNASEAMRAVVVDGLGVAVAPTWLVQDEIGDGRLVRLLHNFEPASLPIHAVYPSRRMVTPRVRAFVDFLAEEFRGDPALAVRKARVV